MNVLVSGRGGGKTFELVQWLKEDEEHRTLVVPTQQQVRWIVDEYKIEDARANPRKVISWFQYQNGDFHRYATGTHQYAIDNLDLCLNLPDAYIVSFNGAARTAKEQRVAREARRRVSASTLDLITGEWSE